MGTSEQTLVLLKPDIVARRLCGEVLRELESCGQIAAGRLLRFTQEECRRHYAHILQEPHYPDVEAYMCSGPTLACVFGGEDVLQRIRDRVLALRERYAESRTKSALHASDSPEAALREIGMFFPELHSLHGHCP